MTDKKRQPSIAQSLEIIFEISSENTEMIIKQSSILKETLDLVSKLASAANSKSVQESELRVLREIKESNRDLNIAFSDNLPNLAKMRDDANGVYKSLLTFFICSIVGIVLAAMACCKIYLQNIELEEERGRARQADRNYQKFIVDEKLQSKFFRWQEKSSER